jgi:hypothetical protein
LLLLSSLLAMILYARTKCSEMTARRTPVS